MDSVWLPAEPKTEPKTYEVSYVNVSYHIVRMKQEALLLWLSGKRYEVRESMIPVSGVLREEVRSVRCHPNKAAPNIDHERAASRALISIETGLSGLFGKRPPRHCL